MWNGFVEEPSSWESAGERANGKSFTVAGAVEVWVGMRVFSWRYRRRLVFPASRGPAKRMTEDGPDFEPDASSLPRTIGIMTTARREMMRIGRDTGNPRISNVGRIVMMEEGGIRIVADDSTSLKLLVGC